MAPRPPGPLFDSARMPESTRAAIGLTKRSQMSSSGWRPPVGRRAWSGDARNRRASLRYQRNAHVWRGFPTPLHRPTEGQVSSSAFVPAQIHLKTCGRATGGVRRPAPNMSPCRAAQPRKNKLSKRAWRRYVARASWPWDSPSRAGSPCHGGGRNSLNLILRGS